MHPFDKERIQQALVAKQGAIMDTQRILLEQMAALPGAIVVSDEGRDLSRILNEQVKNAEFMNRWIELAATL